MLNGRNIVWLDWIAYRSSRVTVDGWAGRLSPKAQVLRGRQRKAQTIGSSFQLRQLKISVLSLNVPVPSDICIDYYTFFTYFQYLLCQQILSTSIDFWCPPSRMMGLVYLVHLSFNFFVFIPCGRLSWLSVSFLLHAKYTLSYRIVWYRINWNFLPV